LPLSSLLFFLCHPFPPAFSSLSLHDALPISGCSPSRPRITALSLPWPLPVAPSEPYSSTRRRSVASSRPSSFRLVANRAAAFIGDRKSTRLNSSHVKTSYAVFCLKTNKNQAV